MFDLKKQFCSVSTEIRMCVPRKYMLAKVREQYGSVRPWDFVLVIDGGGKDHKQNMCVYTYYSQKPWENLES